MNKTFIEMKLFQVKPTKSAVTMMPDADMELPYEGAKQEKNTLM
ncbi:hypothetical protein [Butyrivibrio sp. YAB3001]|nr:hypothetical protein [Butyrivibrio sp. YAB3001]SFC49504.1 hypothetical protein SAMN02910398_02401 [Butyrivibrio sp. YAB3001]